jgi:hypothetical protein
MPKVWYMPLTSLQKGGGFESPANGAVFSNRRLRASLKILNQAAGQLFKCLIEHPELYHLYQTFQTGTIDKLNCEVTF